MSQNPLLYPLTAMALLTFGAMLVLGLVRLRGFRSGKLRMGYFKIFQARPEEVVPEVAIRAQRHFANLFEMPTLFYAGGAVAIGLGLHDWVLTDMAWGYVGFRLAHTIVHLSYNNVMHRFAMFVVSNLLLLAFWLRMTALVGSI